MAASTNQMIFKNSSIPSSPSVFKSIIKNHLEVPVVFKGKLTSYPLVPWTLNDLTEVNGDILLDFRVVSKSYQGISWEGSAEFVEATISQFIFWQLEEATALAESNPFTKFPKNEYWAYSSYNYISHVFPNDSQLIKNTNWSAFGFPELTGKDSTFWLGSENAYTPCHFDAYGCNLVAQVLGRKKWVLFPPADTPFMYPTRIPFEESSIFSSVNILSPNLQQYSKFKESHPHVVILEPGDVLFVPKKWWHFVSSLDSVTTSINTWIKLDSDINSQLEEGITKALMNSFISYYEPEEESWLNPKEELVSPENLLKYMNLLLKELDKKENENTKHFEDNFRNAKTLKVSEKTDVKTKLAENPFVNLECEQIVIVKPIPFSDWIETTNKTCQLSSFASVRNKQNELNLKKVIDCFVHPDVISLISRLLKDN